MPPVQRYTYTGPTDHTLPTNLSNLVDKSIIITGGANGIGASLVRAFVAAGAHVTFGDTNTTAGHALSHDLGPERAHFVQCDITDWDSQVAMFEAAIANSPHKSCDIVIANAGISRSSTDSLWDLDNPDHPPVKPDLKIIDVNVYGSLYTWKLAVHYFRKQDETQQRDRCFIITGSMVAWIDSPANWQYTLSKYGLHGLMRSARRNSWEQGIRINYIAPCYIQSAIRSKDYASWLVDQGVEFGEQDDVAACMLRIASDRAINGKSLMIVPRTRAEEGWVDLDRDDYKDENGEEEAYLKHMQETQLRVIRDRWVVGHEAQGKS